MLDKLKNYSILFCEDNKDLRLTFQLLLKDYTDNIFLAKDGKEGLEIFKHKKVDIIITDIEMPNLNGIDLIKNIRKINKEIPIVIISSHKEMEYLLKAIDYGIDRFLIKPLSKKNLFLTLYKVLEELENKKLAKEYREKLEKEKIKKATQTILTQFIELIPNPILIVQNLKLRYANTAFKMLFKNKIEKFKENIYIIDNFFEKREGFIHSINEFDLNDSYKNRVSIKINKFRQIFQVNVSKIVFANEDKESFVYVFTDITKFEYQKLKSKLYAEMLEELILKSNISQEIKNEIKEFKNKTITNLDEETKQILRKPHLEKISAKDFIETLSYEIKEELDELKDLEEDIEYELENFIETREKHSYLKIIAAIDKYATVIHNLGEFEDLSASLYSLRDILSDFTDKIDDKLVETLKIYLPAILEDLKKWRYTIFESQEANDIHYLDASLLSSILQLEQILKGVEIKDSEDSEIEFF